MEKFEIINVLGTNIYDYSPHNDINISNAFTSLFFELFINPYKENGYFGYETNFVTVKSGDVVIDCGGHFGLFSAWAASKGAKVYTFEPSKTALPFLLEQQKLYPNIEIIPCAVGEKEDIANFTECYFSCGSHLSIHQINQSCIDKEIYPVQITTLDNQFNNQKIDYIKIDVEGNEEQVILGAMNVITTNLPKLAIACYHYPLQEQNITNILLKINKNYKTLKRGQILFAWI